MGIGNVPYVQWPIYSRPYNMGTGNVIYVQWPEFEPRYNYIQCLATSCGKHDLKSIHSS